MAIYKNILLTNQDIYLMKVWIKKNRNFRTFTQQTKSLWSIRLYPALSFKKMTILTAR